MMNSRILVQFLLVCASMGTVPDVCRAEEQASEPEVLVADLNGDGRLETISRRRLGSDTEIGTFYQIVVKDSSGTVLWKSPEILDSNDPQAFGEWHFGVSLPQLVGDVDRDGKVELIAPAPQSDVSPTFFRVLQWTGSAFEPKYSRALAGNGNRGGLFRWTEAPSPAAYWVQHWLGSSAEGGWVVELVSLPEGGEMRTATGVISAKDDGFELLRWIQPPTKVDPTVKSDASLTRAVSYRARLSAEDHANSSGALLKKVSDILRQDRANYHRGTHRDAEDQSDERFASVEAREALASMRVNVRGGSKTEATIITGTPVVDVTISGGAVRVEIVNE